MPQFKTTRRVAHDADRMFELVADVDRYPEFIPLCESLAVLDRREDDGKTIIVADMTVGYRMVRETFRSRVTLDRQARTIRADYVDGPVKHLVNDWRFEPVGPNACKVHFFLDYEFKSRVFARMMGSLFDRVFKRFADAFEARADAVYAP